MKQNCFVLSLLLALTACGGGNDSGINLRERLNSPVQSGQTDVDMQTINGISVPPDPGSANNATLLGIDADRNGIRDDIDRFIAKNFANSPEKRRAAEFLGRMNYVKFIGPSPINRAQAESLVNLRFKNQECYLKEFYIKGREFRVDLPNLIHSLYLNSELRYKFETEPEKMCLVKQQQTKLSSLSAVFETDDVS